jgi:hypothetical protein
MKHLFKLKKKNGNIYPSHSILEQNVDSSFNDFVQMVIQTFPIRGTKFKQL